MESGPDALADYELIELLLFFSVWRRDTKPVAKQLLERFGGIGGLLAADPSRYQDIKELADGGEEDLKFTAVLLKAVQATLQRALKEQIMDRPVISSWTALIDYLQLVMTHEPSEHFRILFLDKKNILIKDEVQSKGTVDHTPLYPREVVKRALELAASAIIMVHNHPSRRPDPLQARHRHDPPGHRRPHRRQHHRPRPRHRRQKPPHQLQVERVDLGDAGRPGLPAPTVSLGVACGSRTPE